MKKCENCQEQHLGSYGSGRFCSSNCARGFSTKLKRNLINDKVALKLKGKTSCQNEYSFKCIKCQNEFLTKFNRYCPKCLKEQLIRKCEHCEQMFCVTKTTSKPKYCSEICKIHGQSNKMINRVIEGLVKSKGIKCVYVFNNKKIKCDSKIEYTCLNYFESNYNVKSIKRCEVVLEYKYQTKLKKYVPDFVIETDTKTFIVECKNFIKNKALNQTWNMYNEKAILKKKCLEDFCINSQYTCFWFTKEFNIKYYRNLVL